MHTILVNGRLHEIAQQAVADAEYDYRQVLVAVTFSVMWLESYVNDLINSIIQVDANWSRVSTSLHLRRIRSAAAILGDAEERRMQLPMKLQLLSVTLRQRPFPKGTKTYQDLDLLYALRHRIVHMQPERIKSVEGEEVFDTPKKILRGLIDRGFVSSTPRYNIPVWWFDAMNEPKVAVWAAETVFRAAIEVAELFPKRSRWRTLALASVPGSGVKARRPRRR